VISKSVSLPLILYFLWNVLFGFLVAHRIYFTLDCSNIIPLLLRFRDMFPDDQFCAANSMLWSNLVYLAGGALVATLSVYIVNWGKLLPRSARVIPPYYRKTIWSVAFLTVFLTVLWLGTGFEFDGRFGSRRSATEYKDIFAYATHQVRALHLLLGTFAFFFLCAYFTVRYPKTDGGGDAM
jgi:hypothetical protein